MEFQGRRKDIKLFHSKLSATMCSILFKKTLSGTLLVGVRGQQRCADFSVAPAHLQRVDSLWVDTKVSWKGWGALI